MHDSLPHETPKSVPTPSKTANRSSFYSGIEICVFLCLCVNSDFHSSISWIHRVSVSHKVTRAVTNQDIRHSSLNVCVADRKYCWNLFSPLLSLHPLIFVASFASLGILFFYLKYKSEGFTHIVSALLFIRTFCAGLNVDGIFMKNHLLSCYTSTFRIQ